MTGHLSFVHHRPRVRACCMAVWCRPPGMGATLLESIEQSVHGICRAWCEVVVRKNFVGVVAETQHEAALAARQLKVQWNPGRRFRRKPASSSTCRSSLRTIR